MDNIALKYILQHINYVILIWTHWNMLLYMVHMSNIVILWLAVFDEAQIPVYWMIPSLRSSSYVAVDHHLKICVRFRATTNNLYIIIEPVAALEVIFRKTVNEQYYIRIINNNIRGGLPTLKKETIMAYFGLKHHYFFLINSFMIWLDNTF